MNVWGGRCGPIVVEVGALVVVILWRWSVFTIVTGMVVRPWVEASVADASSVGSADVERVVVLSSAVALDMLVESLVVLVELSGVEPPPLQR